MRAGAYFYRGKEREDWEGFDPFLSLAAAMQEELILDKHWR